MTLGHACIDNPSRHGCPARGKPRISTPRSSAFQPSQPTLLPPSRSPLRRAKEGRRSRLPAFPPLTRSVKGLRSHARPAPPLEPLNSWPLDPGPHFDLLTLRRFCFLRFCVLAFPPPPDRFTTPANRSGGMLCVWRAPSSRAPFFGIRRRSCRSADDGPALATAPPSLCRLLCPFVPSCLRAFPHIEITKRSLRHESSGKEDEMT